MVYASYDFYTTVYLGGSISEDDFPRLSLRASEFIDYYTQGRAADNAELQAVKMACCAIAEQYKVVEMSQSAALKTMASTGTTELQSQTVGPWSQTYRAGGESAQAALNAATEARKALAGIAQSYLAGTGLLYRGVRCCR